jgi:hypothetical protein
MPRVLGSSTSPTEPFDSDINLSFAVRRVGEV